MFCASTLYNETLPREEECFVRALFALCSLAALFRRLLRSLFCRLASLLLCHEVRNYVGLYIDPLREK